MDKKHLSFTGAGPFYVATISILAVLTLIMDYFKIIPDISSGILRIPKIILGILLIILAAVLWAKGALKSGILECVEDNRLLTSGIYAWCRNPIYSAFMFLIWGICLIPSNMLILVNLPLSYILMGIFLRPTEEKWLEELYGDEYREYCRNVNRAIPWKKRKKGK